MNNEKNTATNEKNLQSKELEFKLKFDFDAPEFQSTANIGRGGALNFNPQIVTDESSEKKTVLKESEELEDTSQIHERECKSMYDIDLSEMQATGIGSSGTLEFNQTTDIETLFERAVALTLKELTELNTVGDSQE